MNQGLKEKTLKGMGWSLVDNLAGSGITFLVGLALARILSPEEFGVIGILTIFIAISNSIVDSGFSNALIRKNDASEEDYNTVFYFNLTLGLLMYVVLFFSAPTIAHFFDIPIVTPTLRVMAIVLLFNALSIIQRTTLVKRIDFKTQAKISIIASLTSAVVGIGMALTGFGVWAMVGQQVSRQAANSLFLWIFNRWMPRLIYSWQSFRELFGFGSKLLLSGLINTIYQNIYQLVIGKFYSGADLGQYTRAQQFQIIFANNLTAVIQRVTYPVLSQIQDEPERLRAAYRKIIVQSMVISFACLFALAAVAKPLIILLIGIKWLPAVGYLQIICIYGALYPLHALNLNMLQVKGRSDLCLKLEIIKKVIGVLPVAVGIFYGITAMLLATLVTSVTAFFLNAHYSGRLIGYSSWDQMRDISMPFFASAISATAAWTLTLTALPLGLMLALQVALGALLLGILYYLFDRRIFDEIRTVGHILRSYIPH